MTEPQFHINILEDIIKAFDAKAELTALCGYTRVMDEEVHDELVRAGASTCEACEKAYPEAARSQGLPTQHLSARPVAELRQYFNRGVTFYSAQITFNPAAKRDDFPIAG